MRCRLCNYPDTVPFLDLGEQPLANRLLSKGELEEPEPKYPLGLEYCKNCLFVQLTHLVPPEAMFLEYPYATGTSSSTRIHFKEMAKEILDLSGVQAGTVIDIGSNDGTLLREFKERGWKVLGIEPASGLAQMANESGISTFNMFFDSGAVQLIRRIYGRSDIVTATNVLTHVPNPKEFLENVKAILKHDGTLVVEIYYLWDLIQNGAFDQCYHEHTSYFSFHTLKSLMDRVSLEIWRVEKVPVQGGSLRIYVSRPGTRTVEDSVFSIAREEPPYKEAIQRYEAFAARALKTRQKIQEKLKDAKSSDQKVMGYGAAAKATVLLNYCEIGPDLIPYVVDKNPLKQGKYIPGVHIPILGPDVLERDPPDDFFIFSWNLAEEIVWEWRHLKDRGARFLVLLPEIEEISPIEVKGPGGY